MAKFGGMYDEEHKIENDGKGNAKAVKKEGAKSSDEKIVHKGGADFHDEHAGERMEMRHRHIKDHVDLHTKHAHEHMKHEGDKKSLHEKHLREHEEMHGRHHKEMKAMFTRHEKEGATDSGEQATVGEPAEKIEKGAK